MHRVLRRIVFGLAGVAAVLVLAGAAGWFWLGTSLPDLDGDIALSGLDAPVTVARDAHGIPFIQAGSERDAAFALGFVHAQDRFAQMELTRRVGAGRMAEILGADLVPMDSMMRTFGVYRLAAADAAALPASVRTHLEAYAAGVNAWMRTDHGALPPEFYALWFEPEPWSVTDSLVWIRLMALRLTGNWNTELLRAGLRRHVPEDLIENLFPEAEGPSTLASGSAGRPAGARGVETGGDETDTAGLWREAGPGWRAEGGSNVWALSGARTSTGGPILANDPHLGIGAPAVWYLAHVETPDRVLAGATVPGLPFLVLGHNGKVAWGLTTTHGDASDLFVERLSKTDDAVYDTPEGVRPFSVRNEVIRVRFAEDVLLQIRSTRHGPVISDVNPAAAEAAGDDHVLALRNSALLPGDPGATALYRVNRANNVAEVREALRAMRAPQQNVAYADSHSIGLSMPSQVPIRRSGDGADITRGWTGDHDWTGFVPFEELPHVADPESGMIVNANNRVVGPAYPHFISRFWPDGYRAERIEDVLSDAGPTDLAFSTALQLDIRSGTAGTLLPVMIDPAVAGGGNAEVLDGLRKWDQSMAVDRWEPLVYEAWLREATRAIFADELDEAFEEWWGARPETLLHALTSEQTLCNDTRTPDVETCGQTLAAALRAALDWTAARYGSDRRSWRWGDAHMATFRHPVFGRVPLLGDLTDIRTPAAGGQHTVNRGGFMVTDPVAPFEMVFGPAYRAVYDLSDLDRSLFIVAPGQSGNPLSPHYGDLVDVWREGRYLTLVPPDDPAHMLRLMPAGTER